MAKYKAIVKGFGWNEHRQIIEANDFYSAFIELKQDYQMLYGKQLENFVSLQELFNPCLWCGTEQTEGIGCTNFQCLSKKEK